MEYRKIFKQTILGEEEIDMIDLKKGDLFRMESTNKEDTLDPNAVYKCSSDGYFSENEKGQKVGTVQIDIED